VIKQFAEWCGRNIESIIWFNVVLLLVGAADQAILGNWHPTGLCVLLLGVIGILRK
jgi:hypothetical protein